MDTMLLLDEYVRTASQDAFRQIVERYINVVYAAARRQVHDEHLAQDVTQAVFFLLARKAKSIPRNRPLTAWLLKTTRYAASNAWRSERRRQKNETRAAIMHQDDHAPEPKFDDLEAMLDEGINHLSGQDRDALLLKFFEQSSLREMGAALGISEDAAQKRVTRAVDRLRDFFRKRGVTVSAVVLTTFLTTRVAEAAPVALTVLAANAPVTSVAASGATLSASLKGVLLMAAMEKIKVAAIATVALILAVGGGVVAVQYTSRGSNVVAAPAPVAPASAPAVRSWPVKFAGNTQVEVTGIQDEKPADSSKWWGPDGLPCPEPHFKLGSRRDLNDPGMRNVRFLFQMTGPDVADKTLHVEIVGAQGEASSGENVVGAYIRQQYVSLPQNLVTTKLRIAVSDGPWVDEVTYDVATGQSMNFTDSTASISSIKEANGMTNVELRFPLFHKMDRDERMLLLVNGREILPDGISRNFLATTYSFRCAKNQVTQAIFRSRSFEWIEMNNVSLTPRETPTNIQIDPVAAPATNPQP